MEKNNSSKIIAIIALVVAVIGLSIGFAAFTTSLTINAKADVTVDQTKFKIQFSTDDGSITPGQVTPSVSGATADKATIAQTTISGINVHFTADSQSATYSFYVYNDSPYTAYLTGVTFANANPQCSYKTEADGNQELLTAACRQIQTTVTAHSGSWTASDAAITGKSLEPNTGAEITVKVESKAGATAVDSAYDATIGNITLNYSTKNPGE